MWHFLMIIGAVTIMTIVGTKEDKETRRVVYRQYWDDLKEKDPQLFKKFKKSLPGVLGFGLPGSFYFIRLLISLFLLCKILVVEGDYL